MSELAGWETAVLVTVCPQCDWRYIVPEGKLPLRCPHCFAANLEPVTEDVKPLPYLRPPELVTPFTVTKATADKHIEAFTGGIPFAPRDLTPDALRSRVQPFYLPMWLVDGDVAATWEAEVGFDYNVVSHQERYSDGSGWATREVEETRIRWEPRVGQLERGYDNIIAPALEQHAALEKALGAYKLGDAAPYTAGTLEKALVRLPDRAPEAAWTDAAPAFQAAAGEECRQAAAADHIRQFRWSPSYAGQNWTLLLLPLYATYYLDDENQPRPVLINGQSGRVYGVRRASMKRAQRTALIILAAATVLFILSLIAGVAGLAVPPLLIIAGIGGLLALGIGLGAIIPIFRAWQFNRKPVETL
jgi:hypothetical protein